MNRLPVAAAAALIVCAVLGFLIFSGPGVHTSQCDGSVPGWMLEAGKYEGGGCAEVFPSEAAPPNADWTLYCLGYCTCQPGGDTVMGACEAVPFINETPEPPAFDLGAVQAHFAAACDAPAPRFDDPFCQTLRPDRLEGEGDALYVRTTLRGRDYDFAVAICIQLASAHFDSVGRDLGYTSVTIVKENGGEDFPGGKTAHCAVRD